VSTGRTGPERSGLDRTEPDRTQPDPTQPDRAQPVPVAGLAGPVELLRGAAGVVLVRAAGLTDAVCGLGYATARDRLFQLDLLRRQAAGRLAELLGPAAVDADVRQRRLDLPAVAARALGALPAAQATLLAAYATGINQAAAGQPPPFEHRHLGVPVEPWQPADSLLVALLLAQLLSGDGQDRRMGEVMRGCLPASVAAFLLSDADPDQVDMSGRPAGTRELPVPAEVADLLAQARRAPRPGRPVVADDQPWGSNAMAVAAARTADGRAILASDMHLPLTAPGLCYRAALAFDGRRVDGVTIPGVPVFVAGCTADLAWGATRLAADTADLRALPPTATLSTRRERVRVRGADPVEIEVQDSRWGPVTGRSAAGEPLALRWACLEPGGVNLGLADLLLAADVDAAAAVAAAARGAAVNLVFADRAGRIGWAVSGSIPDRTPGPAAPNPHPGPENSGPPPAPAPSWTGLREPRSMPRLVDPPDGVIVTANNRPPGITGNHFGARRAARIGQLLHAAGQVTEADLLAVQADVDASFYEFYRGLALAVLDPAATADRPVRQSLRAGLAGWDGTARPAAVGLAALVLFRELVRETWFSCLLGRCLRADPDFRYRWHNHEAPLRALLAAPLAPPPYRGRTAFLLGELDLTARILDRISPGTEPGRIRWGELNRSRIHHPLAGTAPHLADRLNLAEHALPGCAETVNANRPGFGPAFRMVAAPGHLDDALANLPGGQSGDPTDPAYRDQYPAWLAARPTPLAATPGPRPEVTRLAPTGHRDRPDTDTGTP
jgi:penicillin G amidase